MQTALLPLQTSLYELYTGDGTLMALVTGVFDFVPGNQAYPFIRIGEFDSSEWRTHSRPGEQVVVTVHIYKDDNRAARGNKVLWQILDEVNRLTGDVTNISVDGYDVIASWYQSSTIQLEVAKDQRLIRHLIAKYRFKMLEQP